LLRGAQSRRSLLAGVLRAVSQSDIDPAMSKKIDTCHPTPDASTTHEFPMHEFYEQKAFFWAPSAVRRAATRRAEQV
jgi:hypothetical protein